MAKLNRRQFIALGIGGTGIAVAGNWLRQKTIYSQPVPQSSANPAPVYQSSDGLLELDLSARENLVNLGKRQASLLTYNGQIPACLLYTSPSPRDLSTSRMPSSA